MTNSSDVISSERHVYRSFMTNTIFLGLECLITYIVDKSVEFQLKMSFVAEFTFVMPLTAPSNDTFWDFYTYVIMFSTSSSIFI